MPFALLLSTPSEEEMASGWAIKVEILVRLRSAAGVPLWVEIAILGPFFVTRPREQRESGEFAKRKTRVLLCNTFGVLSVNTETRYLALLNPLSSAVFAHGLIFLYHKKQLNLNGNKWAGLASALCSLLSLCISLVFSCIERV